MAFDNHSNDQHDVALTAEAPPDAGQDIAVPLSCLVRMGSKNVRKKGARSSIAVLGALIASQGLMLRLFVVALGDGRFGVVAGGRRLEALLLLAGVGTPAALQELAELGVTLRISMDAPIECKLIDESRAVEASTAENSGRENMHIADQIGAFAELIKSGMTEQQVAVRFGVSPLTVQRRMTMAGAAPRLLEMLRDDAINVGQLQALCMVADHDKQVAVWNALPSYDRSAHMIRQVLIDDELEGDSKLAKFVGLAAYEAAGGAVRRDLFSDENEFWLQDGALAMRLAMERLEAAAEVERAAGWSWVESHWSVDYQTMNRFDQERSRSRRLTADEEEGLDAWTAAEGGARALVSELHQRHLAAPEGSDDRADARRRFEEAQADAANIRDAIACLRETLVEWSPKQLSTCGVIVTVGHHGAIEIKRGLMRPEDRKAIVAELKKAGKAVPAHLQSTTPAKGERAAISERLMLDLTAHRTAALQAALVDNSHVALALVVQRLIEPILSANRYHGGTGSLKLTATLTAHTPLDNRATEYADSPAAAALGSAAARVGELVPGAGGFTWLLAQDDATLMDLLAFCAASSLDAMHGREQTTYNGTDALADALGVDMADWWTPTPTKYLNGVSKVQVIEAVTEACGEEAAKPMAALKKGDAVAMAAAKLEGTRWLPAPLRKKAAPVKS